MVQALPVLDYRLDHVVADAPGHGLDLVCPRWSGGHDALDHNRPHCRRPTLSRGTVRYLNILCLDTNLLNSDFNADSALDQICQEVDLSLPPLARRNRDHQRKFDLLLALSQSVFDPVENRLRRNHQGDELFRFDLVEGLYRFFLGFDDPCVLDAAEFEVDARLLIGHDPNLAHVHFLLEDPACLSGPEEEIYIGYRYAYLCRESSQFLFNFQIPLLCYGCGYLCDYSEPVQVSKDVPVENGESFSQSNVPQKMACLLVAEALDIFNEPFTELEGIVEARDPGFQLQDAIVREHVPRFNNVLRFAVREPNTSQEWLKLGRLALEEEVLLFERGDCFPADFS